MKAQAFLLLVGRMMRAQSNYYANRTQTNLIAAKELESQVRAVLKQNKLEPDEPTPALDFVEDQRPNVPEQKPLFTEGEQ